MKISINWLRDFIDLARLPQQGSAEELDVLLTNTGLEVEGVESHEKSREVFVDSSWAKYLPVINFKSKKRRLA